MLPDDRSGGPQPACTNESSLPQGLDERAVRGSSISRRRLVAALGILWILDGALQLQPAMYSRGDDSFLANVLQDNTMGQPNPLTGLIRFSVSLTYGTPTRQIIFNTFAAVLELAIGLALLVRRTERVGLGASCVWALVPWLVGEALGEMVFPQASMAVTGAPGAAAIYIILSLVLWPRGSGQARDDGPIAVGGILRWKGALGAWVIVWVGTALLELERANWAPNASSAQLHNLADGEPGWLSRLDNAMASLFHGHGTIVAVTMLVLQVWIGWGILRPVTRRAAITLGVGVSLLYWVFWQNFGEVLTGSSTDPNLGPVMVLFALALWPRASATEEISDLGSASLQHNAQPAAMAAADVPGDPVAGGSAP